MLFRPWEDFGNNWAFSAGFALTAGTAYTVTFRYQAPGWSASYDHDNFEVKIGTSQTSAGMTGDIFSNVNNDVYHVWALGSGTFTPATTGTYYLGFHDLNNPTNGELTAEGWYIIIDDIKVITSRPVVYTVNIFCDGIKIADVTDQTSYHDNYTLSACYTVNVNCPAGGVSAMSEEVCTDDCSPATNLQVTVNTDCEATLTWTAAANMPDAKYNIYRGNDIIANEFSGTTYVNNTIDANVTYTRTVKTVCTEGEATGATATGE
jgi:hypothetical protein